jgi:uncharacterized protein with HEPN domain
MPRDYKVSLADLLEAAEWIETYVAGMTLEQFRADRKTRDAVVRNLEVVGEAVKNVPQDVRGRYPHVPWQRIAGLRDILIHEYFGIDEEIVWDIVQNKLPSLKDQVTAIVNEQDDQGAP